MSNVAQAAAAAAYDLHHFCHEVSSSPGCSTQTPGWSKSPKPFWVAHNGLELRETCKISLIFAMMPEQKIMFSFYMGGGHTKSKLFMFRIVTNLSNIFYFTVSEYNCPFPLKMNETTKREAGPTTTILNVIILHWSPAPLAREPLQPVARWDKQAVHDASPFASTIWRDLTYHLLCHFVRIDQLFASVCVRLLSLLLLHGSASIE